jgi:NAD+ synthase
MNIERTKREIIQWIKDWFAENGPDCNAIIGISGGKDSSVAAALCVEALGKDRVYGIMMPNGVQADIDDAINLIEFLNIKTRLVNIERTINALKGSMSIVLSEQAETNLPPRIRMTTLYAISQSLNGRVVCTDNLSESYIGYSTRWGDNVGDFAPLAHLTSDEVVALGDACGLPYELTHKTPTDGLCGKTDEENFGFTYETLNKYVLTGQCEDTEAKEKIDAMHLKNAFKLKPIPAYVPHR